MALWDGCSEPEYREAPMVSSSNPREAPKEGWWEAAMWEVERRAVAAKGRAAELQACGLA